jgi:2-keto-3-deoxy-L-rhamnonate aldolase RhmA
MAEIAGLSGYDFAVVDMEHGPGGITDALHCLRALAATQTQRSSGCRRVLRRGPKKPSIWARKGLCFR